MPYNFGQRIRELEAEVERLKGEMYTMECWGPALTESQNEVRRLESEASKQFQAGFEFGRQEARKLVLEQGRFLPWDKMADAIWSEPS